MNRTSSVNLSENGSFEGSSASIHIPYPFLLLSFILYVIFTALCIVCDKYLIPAVEVFITTYNIPEEVLATLAKDFIHIIKV